MIPPLEIFKFWGKNHSTEDPLRTAKEVKKNPHEAALRRFRAFSQSVLMEIGALGHPALQDTERRELFIDRFTARFREAIFPEHLGRSALNRRRNPIEATLYTYLIDVFPTNPPLPEFSQETASEIREIRAIDYASANVYRLVEQAIEERGFQEVSVQLALSVLRGGQSSQIGFSVKKEDVNWILDRYEGERGFTSTA